jgi:predicted DNA binding CopG/RHH family protein
MNPSQIPQTDSIEELAQFWQTHDLTDFEDQLEEVTDKVFEREPLIALGLHPPEITAVKAVAASRGIDYHDLIREWILEEVSKINANLS